MFQLCFNFNKIHDSVGKALRTANQARVTVNSHLNRLSFRLAASQGESLMLHAYISTTLGAEVFWWQASFMGIYPLTKNVNKSLFSQSS